jgi:acyl-homoserine lactone synthase
MLDVHVVCAANRHLYAAGLEDYFRWRYRCYTLEKGWFPENERGTETDQFDNDEAFHLLAFLDGALVAGTRLMPCHRPTLLSEVFPGLAGVRGVPRAPHQADWTRMFVVPAHRRRGHRGVAGAMVAAVMEYCVEEGVSAVGGVQETYWLPRWMDFGWDVEVLGLPETIAGTSCVAAMFRCTPDALAGVRAATGVERPQIRREGPVARFVETGPAAPAGLRGEAPARRPEALP